MLPSGLWIPLGLIICTVTILSATVNPSTLPGQPEYDPVRHQYGFNNHGVVIPASRAAYLHAVDLQNRLFLAAAVIFTSVAAAITYGNASGGGVRHSRLLGGATPPGRGRESRCP